MERSTMRNTLLAALAALACAAIPSWSAAPKAAPAQDGAEKAPSYQFLIDAANAAVTVKAKAIANARSIKTLGDERTGAGVLIAPEGLVLTIGYLILEADQVEITTARGRTIPATVVAATARADAHGESTDEAAHRCRSPRTRGYRSATI